MYAADHLPPHFHIIGNDGREALVEIASCKVLRGSVDKAAMKEVQIWWLIASEGLKEKWKELNP